MGLVKKVPTFQGLGCCCAAWQWPMMATCIIFIITTSLSWPSLSQKGFPSGCWPAVVKLWEVFPPADWRRCLVSLLLPSTAAAAAAKVAATRLLPGVVVRLLKVVAYAVVVAWARCVSRLTIGWQAAWTVVVVVVVVVGVLVLLVQLLVPSQSWVALNVVAAAVELRLALTADANTGQKKRVRR